MPGGTPFGPLVPLLALPPSDPGSAILQTALCWWVQGYAIPDWIVLFEIGLVDYRTRQAVFQVYTNPMPEGWAGTLGELFELLWSVATTPAWGVRGHCPSAHPCSSTCSLQSRPEGTPAWPMEMLLAIAWAQWRMD